MGERMVDAHKHLKGLQMRHFDAMCSLIADSLREIGIAEVGLDHGVS